MKNYCDENLYGLLKYSSINIGDEVQCIAAMRFLPHVDEYVHRDRINRFKSKSGNKIKLICNAWWLKNIKAFPPSDYVEPLLISMYIRKDLRKQFLTNKAKRYLIDNGPVGCRDMSTCEWLKENGIDAYFSGCLTLTLEPNNDLKKQDYILCVDTSDEIVEAIKQKTKRPVYSISRMLSPYLTYEERLETAKIILGLYQSAHCVVSPRLHVILPSIALGTNVIRIIPKDFIDDGRWRGYEDFAHTVREEDFLRNFQDYDFEDIPVYNSHIELKSRIIEKVENFTGYNNPKSFVCEGMKEFDSYLAVKFLNLLRYSPKKQKRIMYWGHPKQLLRTAFKLFFKIKTKWDM